MISSVEKNIIIKLIKVRISNGENLDGIIQNYPNLQEEDKNEIKLLLEND